MGTTTSLPNTVNVDEISATTGLSKQQISSLWTRFHELDRDGRGEIKGYKGYLDVDDLSRVPKFSANPIAPRLLKVIFDDFGSDNKLNFRQFIDFMSTFSQCKRTSHSQRRESKQTVTIPSTKTDRESMRYLPDDSPKIRKIKFIFHMYDVDHDGRLSKEDVQEILKMMVGKISEDEASIIAEKVIGELTEGQLGSTASIENFEQTLATLDFNDKMGLKLLK